MHCTELIETPAGLVIIAPVYCVASPGGSCSLTATTLSATSAPSGGMRGGGRVGLLAQEAVVAFLHQPLLPTPDVGLGAAGAPQ
ncbi:hypothetical protein WOC76_18890 [Methylocystis sp. IM3]|uniref:hypothetical protein n=1 Tax=Methylocystis sp. IM3 TaxID=3136722 RepID=UPI00311A3A6A